MRGKCKATDDGGVLDPSEAAQRITQLVSYQVSKLDAAQQYLQAEDWDEVQLGRSMTQSRMRFKLE